MEGPLIQNLKKLQFAPTDLEENVFFFLITEVTRQIRKDV